MPLCLIVIGSENFLTPEIVQLSDSHLQWSRIALECEDSWSETALARHVGNSSSYSVPFGGVDGGTDDDSFEGVLVEDAAGRW